MKTSRINSNCIVSFKSLRTDKKQVETLKNGNLPILENKKENILTALNNMTVNPKRSSIDFLLDVAKNLEYGQDGDSEFKDIIDETTDITTPRENTDWSQVLSDTIKAALNNSSEDVSDLEDLYNNLFSTKKPLTPIQKEVLELRQQVRDSIITDEALSGADSLSTITEISKNIDYFISSSEISMTQKRDCLKKFIYFLSDDYKINPQLADKKNQVVSEMLNDMLIKTPAQDELTIKSVNQLSSGMCAAISICRKALAYEDKVRYMDLIFDELKDSPTMEIYDITDLDSGRKITIPKVDIDYNTALEKGYRIIDASAHIWMNNGHASGDGSIQTEKYVAFDKENYGIFDDSSWYEGLNPKFASEKKLLKCLIKENEALDSVLSYRKKVKLAGKQVIEEKRKTIEIQSFVNGKLRNILSSVFPEVSDGKINNLISDLMKFYSDSKPNNEVNVSEKMPDEVKQGIVIDYIKGQVPVSEVQEEKLKAIAGNIISYVNDYKAAESNIKKLQSYNTIGGQYIYYRKLYNLAAAHRLSTEADVNLKDGVVRFEKLSGLPPREQQVISYLKNLSSSISSSQHVRERFLSQNPSMEEDKMQQILYSDILKLETVYPQQLDSISKAFFGLDLTNFIKSIFSDLTYRVKNGEPNLVDKLAMSFNIKKDRTKVLSYIDKWQDKLSNKPKDEDIQEAVRILGFEDKLNMMQFFISSFFDTLIQGISEDQYNELKNRFGGEDKIASAIETQRAKFIKLIDSYKEIEQRWEIPSSRELIIKQLEKTKAITTRRNLDILQKRFDYISKKVRENESIPNVKERRRANRELYKFTDEELEILNSIEQSLQRMKKYCKVEYQSLNNYLFDELEDQYSELGMLNGQFWVREEGSTGLVANEQVRIIEQMTGKPYHIQSDVELAAKQIKEGDGSGIIGYSVDDKSYAFHAQYVPSVTRVALYNPANNKKEIQDILWTDNSWGKSEKEYFWNGHNGFEYTDYGQGYGWKNGFILSKDTKIGQSTQAINDSFGIDSKDNDKFSLFLDVVLPGMPVNSYQKLYKMFSYILNMEQGSQYYSSLETALKNGEKIDVKFLESLDELAEKKTGDLTAKVENIKSKEDYDKLPDSDYLKFIMELLSIYVAVINPNIADKVFEVENIDQVRNLKEEIIDEYIDEMAAIVSKSDKTLDDLAVDCSSGIIAVFDEMKNKFGVNFDKDIISEIIEKIFYNEEKIEALKGSLSEFERYLNEQVESVANSYFDNEEQLNFFIEEVQRIINEKIDSTLRIKSLDSSVLVNSPMYNEFIAAVDKYLNPSSDEELLALIQGLQNADYEIANKFFDVLTAEDLGLYFKHPYEYIKKLQVSDSSISKAFSEIVGTNTILSQLESMNGKGNTEENTDSDLTTPSDLYRNLYVKLSDLDVQKFIRNFKAEAFAKYKVRQAFPEPVILPDDKIAESTVKMFDYVKEKIYTVKGLDLIIDLFDKYDSLLQDYSNSPLFNALLNKEDYIVDSTSAKELIDFRNRLLALKEITSVDASMEIINKTVVNLLSFLTEKKGIIDGKNAGKYLNELIDIFSDWNNSSIDKEKFIQQKNAELSDLQNNVSVMINSNVLPQYRNDAFSKMKNIISLIKDDAPEEDINYYIDELVSLFVERHVIKNPKILLRECVKLLQSGQSASTEYAVMKRYLLDALIVAQQTKIQYKLVQNAHEGISSKTRKLLPLFSVQLSDGSSESMDSEVGILYLIKQLQNESDDHKTLNLFLNQSGLSKIAVNAIINNFNVKSTIDLVDAAYVQAIDTIEDAANLSSIINDFFSKSKIQYSSLLSAIEQLKTYVSRKFANKDSDVYKNYIKYLESVQITDQLKNLSSNMILPLFQSINDDALMTISDNIMHKIAYIREISALLDERFELFNAIKVPENSDESIKKREFIEEYNTTKNYIVQKMQEIQDCIQKTDFISYE